MDRLPTLIAALVALAAACDKGGGSEPPPSRVNAVKADPGQASTAGFCDARFPAGTAPVFQFPALATPAPAAGSGWRWINVWATWCKPCVEEMPRLRQWRERIGGVELVFLSVDEDDAAITAFRSAHPDTGDTLRIAKADLIGPWLESIGLDKGASIPVHVFVDRSGRTRCVRAGGVGDEHFATVKRLLAE
jgi:thiol-disulfide isomerase/thioredoxin